jgi:hypothetical protein
MRAQRYTIASLLAVATVVAVPATAQPGPRPTPVVWTAAIPANEGFERLAAFPSGEFFAQSGPGYAKSTDFGATWSFENGPDDQTGNSGMLEWATPKQGFATVSRVTPALVDPVSHERCDVGIPYFALDVTLNGGRTWAPACTPVAPVQDVAHGVSGFSVSGLYVSRHDSTVLVAGDDAGSHCNSVGDIHPLLFTSSDFGRQWRTGHLPDGYIVNLIGLDVRDSRHLVVLASKVKGTCAYYENSQMFAFATTDGVHYKKVFRCPGIRYCTSAAWVTPHRLIVGLDDGQLFVSNNAGHSFFKGALIRDADYGPAIASGKLDARLFWAQALSFSDGLHGFASTRGSGTWRTTDGGLRWVQEKSPECLYYPFGVGDVSAGDAEHGITGGPPTLDIRQPGEVELGCIGPQHGGPQMRIAAGATAATTRLPGAASVVARIDAVGRSSFSR